MEKSSKQGIEFATVQLLNEDSTVVKTAVTDKKGNFSISNISAVFIFLKAHSLAMRALLHYLPFAVR